MNEARKSLAPSGKLRIGLNYGNFLLVLKDARRRAARHRARPGPRARQAARRPVEFVKFAQAGQLADAVRDGKCDVGFLGAEPQRAAEIAFTKAYLEIPVTFRARRVPDPQHRRGRPRRRARRGIGAQRL